MKIEGFEDIVAWQKARWLTRDVYRLTRKAPLATDFPLRNQIRSSAISVPSNIAEGFERWRWTEFRQFLSIAKASCAELRTQLYIAHDVGYIDEQTLNAKLAQGEEVGRLINSFRNSLVRSAE